MLILLLITLYPLHNNSLGQGVDPLNNHKVTIDQISFGNILTSTVFDKNIYEIRSLGNATVTFSTYISGLADIDFSAHDNSLPNTSNTIGDAFLVVNGRISQLNSFDLGKLVVYLTEGRNAILIIYANMNSEIIFAWDLFTVYLNTTPQATTSNNIDISMHHVSGNPVVVEFEDNYFDLTLPDIGLSSAISQEHGIDILIEDGFQDLLTQQEQEIPGYTLLCSDFGCQIPTPNPLFIKHTAILDIFFLRSLGMWHNAIINPITNSTNNISDIDYLDTLSSVVVDSSVEFDLRHSNLTWSMENGSSSSSIPLSCYPFGISFIIMVLRRRLN